MAAHVSSQAGYTRQAAASPRTCSSLTVGSVGMVAWRARGSGGHAKRRRGRRRLPQRNRAPKRLARDTGEPGTQLLSKVASRIAHVERWVLRWLTQMESIHISRRAWLPSALARPRLPEQARAPGSAKPLPAAQLNSSVPCLTVHMAMRCSCASTPSPQTSSPTRAEHIAASILALGRVTVSDRRSIVRPVPFGSRSPEPVELVRCAPYAMVLLVRAAAPRRRHGYEGLKGQTGTTLVCAGAVRGAECTGRECRQRRGHGL